MILDGKDFDIKALVVQLDMQNSLRYVFNFDQKNSLFNLLNFSSNEQFFQSVIV